jgi:hypothetical protein
MTDYYNAKIYKIYGRSSDGAESEECYIGSTCVKYLSLRMGQHRTDYNKFLKGNKRHSTTSVCLFEKYGVDNCYIELIEAFPCKSKDELRKKEGETIRLHPNCVNRCIAGRTQKEYIQENKEEILEKNNEYYQEHRKQIAEQRKEYRDKNRDKLSGQQKEPFVCDCGSEVRRGEKARHFKSQKHQSFLNTQSLTQNDSSE